MDLALGVLDRDGLVAMPGAVAVGAAQAGQDQGLLAGHRVRAVELGRDLDGQVARVQTRVNDRGVGGRPGEVAPHGEEDPQRPVTQSVNGLDGVEAVLARRGDRELGLEGVQERVGHLLPDAHRAVALDVGVTSDRAGTCARLADISLQQKDIHDLLDGGDGVPVLGQAHRPGHHRCLRVDEPPGQGLDLLAAQAGRLQREVPVEVADGGDVLGIPARVLFNERVVDDRPRMCGLLLQQQVAQRAEQCVVAAEPDLQEVVGDRGAVPKDSAEALGGS